MRAIVICDSGPNNRLELQDRPTPEVSGQLVRVRVEATAVNRADLLQRLGKYPAPASSPADIPGLEFVGTVAAYGPACRERFPIGTRVCGIVAGGSYAEELVCDERCLIAVPESLSLIEAAAIPESFLTAFDALTNQASAQPGEQLLITAVTSSVGLATMQLATRMGLRVWGLSRSAGKLTDVARYGLEKGALINDQTVDALRSEGTQFSVVVDFLGKETVERLLPVVAPKARIVVLGLLSGAEAQLPLSVLISKRISIIGSALRTRTVEEKATLTAAFVEKVMPWIREGTDVYPIIDGVFPIEEAEQAHERMRSNEHLGKIVLTL